jgi:8-oxo-dGTP pyrophosphatase MutT (NUDIX family)
VSSGEIVAPAQGAAAAILDTAGRLLVIRENYDRRRYGFPGGRLEPGESPLDAVVRETREEACIAVAPEDVVGIYRLESGFVATLFRCSIVDGIPTRPATGEIDTVAWFKPNAIPTPVTNLLHHALPDVLTGARGVVRDGLPRVT